MTAEILKYDIRIHVNPKADAWVRLFRECNPGCNVSDDIMLGWFANAMMAMHDFLRGKPVNGGHAQFIVDQDNSSNNTDV